MTALNSRRIVAGVADLWLLPLIGSILTQAAIGSEDGSFAPAATWVGVILVVVLPTAAEGATGQTLGKRIRGLKVVDVETRDRPSWRQVLLRRSWTLPVLVVPPLPGWYGFVLVAILLSVIVSMSRQPASRGWPDRLAHTEVVATGSWAEPG